MAASAAAIMGKRGDVAEKSNRCHPISERWWRSARRAPEAMSLWTLMNRGVWRGWRRVAVLAGGSECRVMLDSRRPRRMTPPRKILFIRCPSVQMRFRHTAGSVP